MSTVDSPVARERDREPDGREPGPGLYHRNEGRGLLSVAASPTCSRAAANPGGRGSATCSTFCYGPAVVALVGACRVAAPLCACRVAAPLCAMTGAGGRAGAKVGKRSAVAAERSGLQSPLPGRPSFSMPTPLYWWALPSCSSNRHSH